MRRDNDEAVGGSGSSEAQKSSRRYRNFTRKGAETKIALADESTFARRETE